MRLVSTGGRAFASTVVLHLCMVAAAQAGVIGRELERAIAAGGTHADTAVILRFSDAEDLSRLAVTDRSRRDSRLLLTLQARSARHRADIEPQLMALGASRVSELWIVNGLAVTVPAYAIKQLAAHPSIARIDADTFVQQGRSQRTPAPRSLPGERPAAQADLSEAGPEDGFTAAARHAQPGWNLQAIHAPELWSQGHTGRGVVVATMDTGADVAHPALRAKWRGGANSWFDPHGEEAAPYDATGHGTQALGVITGGAALGVAPDARWISVRLYNAAGRSRLSDIHRAFQWLMDPDGNPDSADAPDVVNASWALTGRGAGACILEFSDDIRALRSAGIAVVFAAGNDGPAPGTSSSPGNNPGALAVGALDRHLDLARQTSRGPSACDGELFPKLVAPGVNVRTTDLSHGGVPSTTLVSGSSMAAPHAAGVLALLAGAFPAASVSDLESALLRSAHPLTDGHRLIDAKAAFELLRAGGATPASGGLPMPASSESRFVLRSFERPGE
jgi:serine protease AprX